MAWMAVMMVILANQITIANTAPLLEEVYVDADIGSKAVSCGSSKIPCNNLKLAINKCSKGGTIIVEGKQSVSSEIEITKDVSIVGQGDAVIRGNTESGYVFKITQQLDFVLSDLSFRQIALALIDANAVVNISDCTVSHTEESNLKQFSSSLPHGLGLGVKQPPKIKYKALIKVGGRVKKIILAIYNSIFKGYKQIISISNFLRSTSRSSIRFTNSAFIQTSGISLLNVENLDIAMINCTFSHRGIVMENMNHLTMIKQNNLFISNCIFRNMTGGAVYVADNQLSVTISNSKFINCKVRNYTWSMSFMGPDQPQGGALRIIGKVGKRTSVIIKKCLFDRNVNDDRGGGDIRIEYVGNGGETRVEDCAFQNSQAIEGDGGSILILPSKVTFKNCFFTSCRAKGKGGAVSIINRHRLFEIFSNDTSLNSPSFTEIAAAFINCTFTDNKAEKDGGALAVDMGGLMQISRCNFHGNEGNNGAGIFISLYEKKTQGVQVLIKDSMFVRNMATSVGGGVYADGKRKTPSERRKRSELYSIQICNCSFSDNSARSSGQSIYSNDEIQIYNVTMKIVEKFVASHLRLEDGNIELNDVHIKLFRRIGGRLGTKSMGIALNSKEIKVSNGLTIKCPTNFKVDEVKNTTEKTKHFSLFRNRAPIVTTKLTSLRVDCVACPFGSYTLQKGHYRVEKVISMVNEDETIGKWNRSRDFESIIQNPICMPCPTGAICDTEIIAEDNFWGYTDASSSSLSLQLCPEGYCCNSQSTKCFSFNTCSTGRTGTLCGTCSESYKLNFIGNDCIAKEEQCDSSIFIAYFILYTLTYTIVFIIITNIKEIIGLLKAKVCKKRSSSVGRVSEDPSKGKDDISIAGFVQVTILFFQVAGLLQVKYQGGQQGRNSPGPNEGVRESINDMFSFRFTLYQQLCPSDSLSLPQKEMILFSMKLATFIVLPILMIFHKVMKGLFHCCRYFDGRESKVNSKEPSIELMVDDIQEEGKGSTSNEQQSASTLSFSSMLKCTFIKLLKLYYTPVTVSALMMVHCVTILDKSNLYVSGDQVCYSWWQIGIIALLPCLLMFPVGFELSLRLLKKRQISSWQFVCAAGCPIYALIIYVMKRESIEGESRSAEEESFRITILEGEESLFREVEGGSLGWTAIQFYRTFAITILNTFLVNPIYRQLAYMILLMLFVVHDGNRKPYKNEYLNFLQSLTSRCLVVVLVCNVIPAMSYMVNVRTIRYINDVVEGLGVVELMVYAAVPLSLPVWKLKSFIENKKQE